jgi:2-oxoisovalerate dehydrogenase E1 component
MGRPQYEDLACQSAFWPDAFLIRSFEERLLKLFSEGKLFGTVHTCIGQEFTGIAVASQLIDGDRVVSNHRCHGHYLARTRNADGLMAEVMGRITGICGGRGGSQHICDSGVYSNGVQGGMTPVAAGMALEQKLNHPGNIVVAFIGDGTLGEGTLYETLNIISKWDLPLMIVLENNLYAQSTSQTQTLAGDICSRAEAFGIASYHGDTANPTALQEQMAVAVGKIRKEGHPAFFRIDTSRLMAHSKGDDDRPKDLLAKYWANDPITRFTAQFPEQAAAIKKHAEELITNAVELALDAPFAQNGEDECVCPTTPRWHRTEIEGKERVVTRIYEALKNQLTVDDRSFILGEDIEGPYGGAFKVTKDLSLQFAGRVRNTPISEAAIVGIGNGLALTGMHPVCEIMFGDFLSLAADQIINHASKFRWMYNDQVRVPLIIRTPMGGRRGYGATHSQSLEKHFLGLPGTRVLALNPRIDPYLIYDRLFATIDRPTIVIENKTMYGEYVSHQTMDGFWAESSDEQFPTTRIRSLAKPDVTVVCYGGCLGEAEKAADRLFDEHELVVEIVCPVQIYPLNIGPILDSVKRSGRLLVVEEGQGFCGFGAEVVAAVLQAMPRATPLLARRLSALPHPLASSKAAELESLPGADSILANVVEMVGHG